MAFTSTRLRKHIATISQVLNLQENESDQLADFLGHDIRVDRQYYRLPQGTLQLAKMSKVLLAVEKGTLSQYKGQALDDIEIDPEGMDVCILVQLRLDVRHGYCLMINASSLLFTCNILLILYLVI